MNIAVEMLNAAADVKITHVPYRGAAPAINDLLGGHVDMLNADLPILLPLVKAGSVKALALFAERAFAAIARFADDRWSSACRAW